MDVMLNIGLFGPVFKLFVVNNRSKNAKRQVLGRNLPSQGAKNCVIGALSTASFQAHPRSGG